MECGVQYKEEMITYVLTAYKSSLCSKNVYENKGNFFTAVYIYKLNF